MAVTYTTIAIVRQRVKNISASVTDGDITENIDQAESTIDTLMKAKARGTSPLFTFDANKHGIIRDCCTNYVAYVCCLYDLSEFPSTELADSTLTRLWAAFIAAAATLSEPRTPQYLKSL